MAEKGEGPKLGPYSLHEVLSSLRKTIKLNDLEQAIYWTHVCLTFGGRGGARMICKQLWIMAAEDIDDTGMVIRIASVWQMLDIVPETDHVFFLVGEMCRAQKWWETPHGRAVDEAWAKAIGDLKRAPREIPGYALDRHTRRGWELKKQGVPFDDRFSGTEIGRMKTRYLYEKYGEISAEYAIDEGFWEFWNRRKELMAEGLSEPAVASSDDDDNGQERLL